MFHDLQISPNHRRFPQLVLHAAKDRLFFMQQTYRVASHPRTLQLSQAILLGGLEAMLAASQITPGPHPVRSRRWAEEGLAASVRAQPRLSILRLVSFMMERAAVLALPQFNRGCDQPPSSLNIKGMRALRSDVVLIRRKD